MSYLERINGLERDLSRLRVEFERFFNGALPVPPEELRHDVEQQLRALRSAARLSALESFRLAGLEARFTSLSELFGRRLRDRESALSRVSAQHLEPPSEPIEPAGPVVLDERLVPALVEKLYRQVHVAAPGTTQTIDLGSFRRYLDEQLSRIRSSTGCAEVEMRVVNEQGRLKLKARPIPPHHRQAR